MSAEIDAQHAETHGREGTTIHVYLPPGVPYDVVDELMDEIATVALDSPAVAAAGEDAFVWSNAGEGCR